MFFYRCVPFLLSPTCRGAKMKESREKTIVPIQVVADRTPVSKFGKWLKVTLLGHPVQQEEMGKRTSRPDDLTPSANPKRTKTTPATNEKRLRRQGNTESCALRMVTSTNIDQVPTQTTTGFLRCIPARNIPAILRACTNPRRICRSSRRARGVDRLHGKHIQRGDSAAACVQLSAWSCRQSMQAHVVRAIASLAGQVRVRLSVGAAAKRDARDL
jgi:hypothetical protein